MERLREVIRDQQRKIRVVCIQRRILVGMAVDCHNAVGVFIHHHTMRIHAEGPDPVLVFFRPVDDLRFIQRIGHFAEGFIGHLHPHTDVDAAALRGDLQGPAHRFHPFAAAAACGENAPPGPENFAGIRGHGIQTVFKRNRLCAGVEEEIHPVLQSRVQVFQHNVVQVRSQMPDTGLQQMQVVLKTLPVNHRIVIGVEPGRSPTHPAVDFVHVFHQFDGFLFPYILVQCSPEFIGDVVLPVGKRTGSPEAVHDGTRPAPDAGLDFLTVYGTPASLEGAAFFQDCDGQICPVFREFQCRENPAGTGTDDQYVVYHFRFLTAAGFLADGFKFIHSRFSSFCFSVDVGLQPKKSLNYNTRKTPQCQVQSPTAFHARLPGEDDAAGMPAEARASGQPLSVPPAVVEGLTVGIRREQAGTGGSCQATGGCLSRLNGWVILMSEETRKLYEYRKHSERSA